MSLVLQTTGGKSHLVHLIDTPGHVNFVDEVASAMRLADGIILVVDVVEGVRVFLLVSVATTDENTSSDDGKYRGHYSTRLAREHQNHTSGEQN